MKTLKKLAPHAAILIGNMYYVFWGIDRVNKAMNFIDNGYTKFLLLVMIVLPYALMLVSYFMYLKRYKLDEPEYDRICEELRERRAQKHA